MVLEINATLEENDFEIEKINEVERITVQKINGMLTKKLNLLRQQKQSQAQFKRRTLYVPNLIPIWVDPNDNNSTVNSGVELN